MKNVLVLIHDDPGQEARLQAALDVVRGIGGHLSCVDVVGVSIDGGLPGPEALALLIGCERREEAANRRRVEARLAGEDVAWSTTAAEGEIAFCVRDAAALADLIVLNPRLEHADMDMRRVASEAVLKSGKPILIVPPEQRGFEVAGPALVAWDGSLAASAALAAAVPLLKLAAEVRILEIQGSSEGGCEEAAAYVSRHGISAEIDRVACFAGAPHEASAVIQDMAEQARCTWCVMGAYGHSRPWETFFGGVTRRVLGSAHLPIFLAH